MKHRIRCVSQTAWPRVVPPLGSQVSPTGPVCSGSPRKIPPSTADLRPLGGNAGELAFVPPLRQPLGPSCVIPPGQAAGGGSRARGVPEMLHSCCVEGQPLGCWVTKTQKVCPLPTLDQHTANVLLCIFWANYWIIKKNHDT